MPKNGQSKAMAAQGSEPEQVINAASRIGEKRGIGVYRTNPSLPGPDELRTRVKRFEVPGGRASVIVDGSTGEMKGMGGLSIWWQEEVDPEKFVKLFLDGIRGAAELTKTGLKAFELVYYQMQTNPNSDKIELSSYMAKERGLNERTFRRGVRELLEKQFIFRSPVDGVYWTNIRMMFNGNRLNFIKTYYLRNTTATQGELDLNENPALPAPEPGAS
jgi:hypothetical protein